MLIRQFTLQDIFRLNRVNLDAFTENYDVPFYTQYISSWPDLCWVAEAADGTIVAYILGKVEGEGDDWHGHITAISVAGEFRGSGVAHSLLDRLESASFAVGSHYVDLYVRASNAQALKFYAKRNYKIHQTIEEYYSDGESAHDMRLYR